MRLSIGSYQIYVYAAVLALLSFWVARLTVDDAKKSGQSAGHVPDYYSIDYEKWEMDGEGQVKSHLKAAKVTHYQDDNTTHFEQPVMLLYDTAVEPKPPWQIQAEQGILSADRKQLLLQGQARIQRAAAGKNRALTINTSDLTVLPDEAYAHTQAWAELLSPPHRTEGIGMKLWYEQPVSIELFANVKGHYEFK
ncbi:MAG: LPS export ABC transporter periplasmic protein LptC [Methylococcales bacterium]|nr:LPS export ABC transporter periplasmic protein LptC [Methylococcales bacterium]